MIHVKLPENIDTIELAIALSNLLDNAIEAEQKEQEQEIHLNMEVVDEMFNLIVENHIQNSVLCVNPKLVTSKKNKAEHGLGIPTVREIVNQYQGFLNISEEANNVIENLGIDNIVKIKKSVIIRLKGRVFMSGLSKMIADFFVRENVIVHEEYEIYKYGSDILLEGERWEEKIVQLLC